MVEEEGSTSAISFIFDLGRRLRTGDGREAFRYPAEWPNGVAFKEPLVDFLLRPQRDYSASKPDLTNSLNQRLSMGYDYNLKTIRVPVVVGQVIEGTLQAGDRNAVARRLLSQGHTPISIDEGGSVGASSSRTTGIRFGSRKYR